MSLTLAIALSALTRPRRVAYGRHRSQVADLHLPAGPGPHPVAVVLHGGSWQQRYGRLICRPLARDLAARGVAAWNLEYRRVGGGGGWPQTFDDVAAGVDALDGLDAPLDLTRTALVGHSAGGQLALWAAGRGTAACVVGLAPVTALRRSGTDAVRLMGGPADALPEPWSRADPLALAPPPVPALLVHPEGDTTIPVARSREYAQRCRDRGGDVTLLTPAGGVHRDPIDPAGPAWALAAQWLGERLA